MNSRRKAIKDLAQSKVVDISDYRNLRQGKEAMAIALVGQSEELYEALKKALPEEVEFVLFDSRFSFEKAVKDKEWSAVLIDETSLKEDAVALCEKLKRQNRMEELVVIILSDAAPKDQVRQAFEKGADEWVGRLEDPNGIIRLLDHHVSLDR